MSDEKRRILGGNPIHIPNAVTGLERIETGVFKDPPCQVIPPNPVHINNEESSCSASSILVLIYILIFILIIVLSNRNKNVHHTHQTE